VLKMTCLCRLHWLDYVIVIRGRHHRAYSLAWLRNKVRGRHHRAYSLDV